MSKRGRCATLVRWASWWPGQRTAADRVGAVISSSPLYRFDGERLQLVSEKTTVTFALLNTKPLVNGSTG